MEEKIKQNKMATSPHLLPRASDQLASSTTVKLEYFSKPRAGAMANL